MEPDLLPSGAPRDQRLAALEAQVAALQAQLAARDAQVAAREARIAELEAQLAAELLEHKRGWARRFGQELVTLLREALALKASATDRRAAEYEAATTALEERLDGLLAAKRRFTDGDNARLAARLRRHRPDILRFLYWAEVDATNNRTERQLRPAVITRKTGGCNRTAGGATTHAILASVLATCRQQAVSIWDYLIKL